jgi:hypothetical protein
LKCIKTGHEIYENGGCLSSFRIYRILTVFHKKVKEENQNAST